MQKNNVAKSSYAFSNVRYILLLSIFSISGACHRSYLLTLQMKSMLVEYFDMGISEMKKMEMCIEGYKMVFVNES